MQIPSLLFSMELFTIAEKGPALPFGAPVAMRNGYLPYQLLQKEVYAGNPIMPEKRESAFLSLLKDKGRNSTQSFTGAAVHAPAMPMLL